MDADLQSFNIYTRISYMQTFPFHFANGWLHPDVEAGSEEEMKLTQQHKIRGKMSVDKSIENIRSMVVAGKL